MGSPQKPMDVEMGDMSEEAKLNPPDVDVKTDSDVKKNGEVKEPRFTGLKKEELLKISSQSHWVRARWCLFILFWLIWLAMLIGAILIVVNAPRCKPEPKPEWYQDTVVYEVDAKEYAGGFEEMKEHLPYLESLHTKSILLAGANDPDDVQAVVNDDEANFTPLVKAIQEKDDGKVLIDVVVDSVTRGSSSFKKSDSAACAADTSGEFCDFLVWKEGNKTQENGVWIFSETRNALFKGDTNRAYINYGSEKAMPFILDVLNSWFNRSIDGVKIRDIAKLNNITPSEFVSKLWNETFLKNESNPEQKVRALFIYSSSPNAELTPVILAENDTNTAHSPVFLNDEIVNVVGTSKAGEKMQNMIKNWREQARNIGGYLVSPIGLGLAAARFPNFAAGLNILSLTLPGVPILRSGDELAAASPVFTWKDVEARDSVPINGSSYVLQQTKEVIVRRVEGIQAEQSLRYDTRSNDTMFNFLNVDNPDIIAFTRQWDIKKAILVVSNLSSKNHTVNLMVDNGLTSEKKLVKEAKVLASSLDNGYPDKIKLDKVTMNSGLTLMLST